MGQVPGKNTGKSLNAYAARKKQEILERLARGADPGEGFFDAATLRDCLKRGTPRIGSTTYEPMAIHLEFIFSSGDSAGILRVTIVPPERIVYLAVPDWVVDNSWQGFIEGTYEFESLAMDAVEKFSRSLEPEPNGALFGARQPTRRE